MKNTLFFALIAVLVMLLSTSVGTLHAAPQLQIELEPDTLRLSAHPGDLAVARFRITNRDTQNDVEFVLNSVNGATWLRFTPASGTIKAGSSVSVDVVGDAAALKPSHLHDQLQIRLNGIDAAVRTKEIVFLVKEYDLLMVAPTPDSTGCGCDSLTYSYSISNTSALSVTNGKVEVWLKCQNQPKVKIYSESGIAINPSESVSNNLSDQFCVGNCKLVLKFWPGNNPAAEEECEEESVPFSISACP